MSIVKKIVREGNSKVINLGSDIADALGVTWDDELEIVVLNNIAVMRKRGSELEREIISDAITRLDIEAGDYGLSRSHQKVLGVVEGSESEVSIDEVAKLAGVAYSYAAMLLRRLALENLIERTVHGYKRKE